MVASCGIRPLCGLLAKVAGWDISVPAAQALTALARIAARIAIACSGLGHVRRGIESWASDLAQALNRLGHDVTLFSGGPTASGTVVPNLRRTGAASDALARSLRHFGAWRYGMGSTYDVEQISELFARIVVLRKSAATTTSSTFRIP